MAQNQYRFDKYDVSLNTSALTDMLTRLTPLSGSEILYQTANGDGDNFFNVRFFWKTKDRHYMLEATVYERVFGKIYSANYLRDLAAKLIRDYTKKILEEIWAEDFEFQNPLAT